MNRILLLVPAFLLALSPVRAQNTADSCSDDFRNWVKIIGSDEFGGRKPDTDQSDVLSGPEPCEPFRALS